MSKYDPKYIDRLQGGADPTRQLVPSARELAVRVKRDPNDADPLSELGSIPRDPMGQVELITDEDHEDAATNPRWVIEK